MKILSITVQHDPVQDRILLLARDSLEQQPLFLTRRLAFGLLSALGKLIQQSQGNSLMANSGLQNELLSMQHAHALTKIRESQPDHSSTQLSHKRLPDRLLSKIDINNELPKRNLIFSDLHGPIASLVLDARQLHWFIGRLASHCRSAGWGDPVPTPEWLDPSTSVEFVSSQARTHSIQSR
jgi:hypothetical protein